MTSPESRRASKRARLARAARVFGMLGWPLRAIGVSALFERSGRRLAVELLLLASLWPLGGCQHLVGDPEGRGSPDTEGRPRLLPKRWAPYPPGRWRLVTRKALEPVVIWVSHILVRHAQAADEESFSFADWKSVDPPVTRTRAEALDRAREIADLARLRPEQFPELARLHSEDITNREQGGSLGGLRASQLLFWPQVLDAFAAIRPGEVSEPVETRFGFHIFLRQAPPPEETLSGQHIVISHDRVKWSAMTTCKDELPRRTREEALSLATTIFLAVQAQPESFADAVQRYSEDCDVAAGGDFGSWSAREVAPFERRLEVLRILAPGQTAPPRETHVGFEIIRRTPERRRPRLAAELIAIHFDPWAAESEPNSKQSALRNALEVARELEDRPARFVEFQRMYCCAEPFAWNQGREPPGLRSVLSSLKAGETSFQPVRTPGAYTLVRKLDPTDFAIPTPSMAELELPSPKRVPLRSLIGSLPFDVATKNLSRLSDESAGALGLSPDVTRQLSALLGDWAATSEALTPNQREDLLELAIEESRVLMAPDLHARYTAALEAGMAESVLSKHAPMF
jgi:hypothetical protein